MKQLNFRKGLFFLFCLVVSASWSTVEEIEEFADKGYVLYKNGDFQEAADPLKTASEANHPLAQELYADICLRKLDGQPHPLKEAAMWYLLAACGGDPDAFSYLQSRLPGITFEGEQDRDLQMNSIVRGWVVEETIHQLEPIKPGIVNDFLVFRFGEQINITRAMKLPYFFDKVMSCLCYEMVGFSHSVIDDQVLLDREASRAFHQATPLRCSMEATEQVSIVLPQPQAFSYGPLYYTYWKSLKDLQKEGKFSGNFLPKPSKERNIPSLYKKVLEAFYRTIRGKNATELVRLSHCDAPWILAGIEFWKKKNPGQVLISGAEDDQIIQQLEEMKEDLPREIKDILLKKIEADAGEEDEIERENSVWPNNGEDHEVLKTFQSNLLKFFQSPLSRASDIVIGTRNLFFEGLRTQILDCTIPNDMEVLETPLCMFFVENLELRNVNWKHYKAIEEGQRYFTHLRELTISFDKDFNPKTKSGKKMESLLQQLEGYEIKVTRK